MGVKQRGKIEVPCTHCFAPVYVKFNFSYICYDDGFTKEHQLQFLERMRELSRDTYLVVANQGKNRGFEFLSVEKLQIRKQIPSAFLERFGTKFDGKLAIVRLYPNNNPTKGRIIGAMMNKIFYIFYVDCAGTLYRHE